MTSAPAPNPAVRFLSWYRGLFARGGKWIAVALLLPCCALSVLYGGAQSLGIIETPPTSTPAPTRTPRPTATARPTDVPPTAEPTAAPTDVPPTAAPALPQPVMQVPPPVQPTAVPPVEAPIAPNDPNTKAKCADFGTRTAAQRWWNHWHAQGIANPGGLDGSDPPNGIVCEHLPR